MDFYCELGCFEQSRTRVRTLVHLFQVVMASVCCSMLLKIIVLPILGKCIEGKIEKILD